jgi:competence protein ComEC
MHRFAIGMALTLVGLIGCPAPAIEPEDGAVFARVLDVGPGLACIVVMPGERYMIYDAGHWNTDRDVLDAARELIPEGSDVDLMVLSHSDADHLGAVDELCDAYRIRRVLRGGLQRTTNTWMDADNAIRAEREHDGCVDINLRFFEYPVGATYFFDDVAVQMVSGFHEPPADWGPLSQSEERNAPSIVVRLVFAGKSILFCGDAVGRHIDDPVDSCIAAEKFMVDNAGIIPIDSDVIIAPHHGADNGSSTAFIEAVSPEFVVFSAGHDHGHPTAAAAQRYLDFGVSIDKIFRCDLGDDEGDEDEWTHWQVPGTTDGDGDDTVDILTRPTGQILVEYKGAA